MFGHGASLAEEVGCQRSPTPQSPQTHAPKQDPAGCVFVENWKLQHFHLDYFQTHSAEWRPSLPSPLLASPLLLSPHLSSPPPLLSLSLLSSPLTSPPPLLTSSPPLTSSKMLQAFKEALGKGGGCVGVCVCGCVYVLGGGAELQILNLGICSARTDD